MIKVYIISGFLGSGKTTMIKKLLSSNDFSKVMLIENEFGEVGIDGNLFDDKLNIKEINSGCICCSLKGDLKKSLEEIKSYDIDKLIIEPSGVGKLSEIISVIVNDKDMELASHICMVDAKKAIIYHKNFKEFFDDQVIAANVIILSRVDLVDDHKLNETIKMLEELNDEVKIVTTPYLDLDTDYLHEVILQDVCKCEECVSCFNENEAELEAICNHHEHHHDHDCNCGCNHHDHDHHHEHHHDNECGCGHHHHEASEVFENIGFKTIRSFSKDELSNILNELKEDGIIRAKGFVKSDNSWLYFDLAGDDIIIHEGEAKYTGMVVVIGSNLDHEKIERLFAYE